MLYTDAIKKGSRDPRLNYLIAYGTYLMNGGKKEDFEGLTEFDLALIRITHETYRQSEFENLVKLFSQLFGGKEDG